MNKVPQLTGIKGYVVNNKGDQSQPEEQGQRYRYYVRPVGTSGKKYFLIHNVEKRK